jgi:hypothetical protein
MPSFSCAARLLLRVQVVTWEHAWPAMLLLVLQLYVCTVTGC